MTVKPHKSVKQQTDSPPKQSAPQELIVPQQSPAATSDEALDRHLAEWSGGGGRLLSFNGSTGIHRFIDDKTELADGTQFIALLHATQKGFIRFNVDAPPTVHMVGIEEAAKLPERKALGDNDPAKWPLDMNNQRADPWKEQFCIPLARYDASAALFLYVARGVVAMNSVRNLLGEWRVHPKRQAGLIPVIAVKNGTYFSKKLNCDRPKPILEIVLWVTRTGDAPSSAQVTKAIEQAHPFNDEVGF